MCMFLFKLHFWNYINALWTITIKLCYQLNNLDMILYNCNINELNPLLEKNAMLLYKLMAHSTLTQWLIKKSGNIRAKPLDLRASNGKKYSGKRLQPPPPPPEQNLSRTPMNADL